MIIVKTNNGDRFINETETLQVNHIKDKAQVEVWPSRWGNQQQQPQYYVIEHVEQVIYTDHPHDVDWVDNCSELEKLKAMYDEHLKWGDKLRKEYMEMEKERDMLKDKVTKLENRIKTLDGMNTESTQKQKISLRATSPMGSDCTQAFDVDGCDGMTVKDFILNVINNDPYVTIDFMRDGKYIWNVNFTNQEPQNARPIEIPEGLYGMIVKSARAAGGYGQMSYNVKLY